MKQPCISLDGCAGLHHMMFGIASFIEENYSLENVNLKTISGSNYVAASLLSKFSTRSIWHAWSMRQSKLLEKYPYSYFFKLYKMTEAHTLQILNSRAKQNFNNHYVLITYLFKFKKEWINKFHSNLDYVKCLIAGSFIPFFVAALQLRYYFRKIACLDGGIPFLPILNKHAVPKSDIRISTPDFRKYISTYKFIKWLFYGLYSKHEHHKLQFNTGYSYAKKHLKNKLDKVLVNNPQKFIQFEGKYEWNGNGFI